MVGVSGEVNLRDDGDGRDGGDPVERLLRTELDATTDDTGGRSSPDGCESLELVLRTCAGEVAIEFIRESVVPKWDRSQFGITSKRSEVGGSG